MMSGCTHLFPLTDHHPSTLPKRRQPSPTQEQNKAWLSPEANDRIDKHPYPFVSLSTKRHRRRTGRIFLLRNLHSTTSYRAAPYLSRSRQTSTIMNRPGRTHPHDFILLQPPDPALQAKSANIRLSPCFWNMTAPRETCAPIYAFTSSTTPLATFNPSADLNDPVHVSSGSPQWT
jgi:hypothetical protein